MNELIYDGVFKDSHRYRNDESGIYLSVRDMGILSGDSGIFSCQDIKKEGRATILQVDREPGSDRNLTSLAAQEAHDLFKEEDDRKAIPVSDLAQDIAYHIEACISKDKN